jgi:S1-C subfamily serine protease
VIKLDDPPKELAVSTFADSSKLKIGQIVLAMGTRTGPRPRSP